MKSINIGAFIPKNMYSTNIYRGSGVFSELRHMMPDIQVFYPPMGPDWETMVDLDIVFLMKASTREAVMIMEQAKTCGKPTWYDLDDDLFNIPLDNPSYDYYSGQTAGAQEIPQNIRILISNCDVVTVSTENLKREVEKLRPGKETIVIPNALDDYMLPNLGKSSGPRKKLITWRGGASHIRDLDSFEPQIMELVKALPDWKWLFMGHKPYRIIEAFPDRVFTCNQLKYYDYMSEFWGLGSAIHIVPLVDNAFNRSKSNISALEGLYAGSWPIVPELGPEWEFISENGFTQTQERPFSNLVKIAVEAIETNNTGLENHENVIERRCNKLKESVFKTRILSVVNKQRVEIIERLVK